VTQRSKAPVDTVIGKNEEDFRPVTHPGGKHEREERHCDSAARHDGKRSKPGCLFGYRCHGKTLAQEVRHVFQLREIGGFLDKIFTED
jgi:hypothetical protein